MAQVLPPAPIDAPFGSYNWADWYEQVRRLINDVTVITWSQINDFTGSNLTDLQTRLHSSLQTIEGSGGYHLSAAEHAALVAGFTGTGALVRATTPTLVTPVIGAATGTSLALTGGITTGTGTLHTSSVALTNGAAAAAGTLANAPAAGNPTKWIPIDDNGTIRYIPSW
jgi:hypothetical protein